MDYNDDCSYNCNYNQIYKMKNENINNSGYCIKYFKCDNLLLHNYKYNRIMFQSRTDDFNCVGNDNLFNYPNS
jgi:hypothetical protein